MADTKQKPDTGGLYNPNGSHDDGISPGDQAKFDQIEKGEQDIATQEANASTSDGQSTSTSNQEDSLSSNDKVGQGYNEGSGKTSRFSRRQKLIAGGGVVGLITSIIAITSIATGPLQVMQFASLLQRFHFAAGDSVMDGRKGRFINYIRFPENPEQRRIGTIGRRLASNVEAKFKSKGLDPDWVNGRLTRLRVDPANLPGLRSAGLGPEIKQIGGDFFIDIDPPGTSKTLARTRINNVIDVVGTLDVKVGAISARQLKTKAGVRFFDLSVRRTVQDVNARIRGDPNAEPEASGRDAYEQKVDSAIREDGLDIERVNSSEPDPDDPDTNTRTDTELPGGSRVDIEAQVRRAGTGIAAVGLVCAAYHIADSADDVRQANLIIPLMKTSMRVMTIASQTMMGEVDLEELGFFIDDLYDENAEPGHRAWHEAASIQANLGEPITGADLPATAHPANSGNFLLNAFNNLPGAVGQSLGTICSAVESKAGQAASYVIDFFTGGVSAVAKGLATEFLASQFVDDIVTLLAGDQVDPKIFIGTTLGSGADYGALLASNERNIGVGGRKLSNAEVLEIDNKLEAQRIDKIAKQSIYDRYINLKNTDSLVANVALSTISYSSLSSASASLGSFFNTGIFSNFGSLLGYNYFSKKASAAPAYSYDLPRYGFSESEINDPKYDNPFENELAVQAALENSETAEKIKKCFGVELKTDKSLVPIEGAIKVFDDDRDNSGCDDTSEEWTRIRFYVLDEAVAANYACFEGYTSDCTQTGDNNNSGDTGLPTMPSGPIIKTQDTSNLPCAPGATNERIVPIFNSTTRIKLCTYGGILDVNASWSPNVKAMYDAALADNITLAGTGWRSSERQIELRRAHCGTSNYAIYEMPSSQCRPPTAKPGRSNHEVGLAIDFNQDGITLRRTDSGFTWLKNNAGRFDIKNLPSEAWHWSYNGN